MPLTIEGGPPSPHPDPLPKGEGQGEGEQDVSQPDAPNARPKFKGFKARNFISGNSPHEPVLRKAPNWTDERSLPPHPDPLPWGEGESFSASGTAYDALVS